MSNVNTKRIMMEMERIREMYDAETVDDNLNHWQIAVHGPDDTPYFGYTFLVEISFPETYPFKKPSVVFKTPIYHPNISRKGEICLSLLTDWKPKNTIAEAISSIIAILRTPNPNDPLEPEIASHYISDRKSYEEKARNIAEKHAV